MLVLKLVFPVRPALEAGGPVCCPQGCCRESRGGGDSGFHDDAGSEEQPGRVQATAADSGLSSAKGGCGLLLGSNRSTK